MYCPIKEGILLAATKIADYLTEQNTMTIKPGDVIKAADVWGKKVVEYTISRIFQVGDEVRLEVRHADGSVSGFSRDFFAALVKDGDKLANQVELDATEL